MRVNVIGACNIDITALAGGTVRMHDSNPATVRYTHGGVGRNIAHNCSLLGLSPRFVSAVGRGPQGEAILSELRDAGCDVSGVIVSDEYPTGSYISFIDENGDLLVAANSMVINELIVPGTVSDLDAEDAVTAFDTNIPEETIDAVTSLGGIKYAEPVSGPKCVKLLPYLSRIDIIKPNVYEAAELCKTDTSCEDGIIRAGMILREKGVKKVFITESVRGAWLFSGEERIHFVPETVEAVSANGAGDAFSSGIIYGTARGLGDMEILRFSCAAAACALEHTGAVNMSISEKYVLKKAGLLKNEQ